MISRARQTLKKHRCALPRVLLGKLLGGFIRTETLAIFSHDPQARSTPLPTHDPLLRIVRIDMLESEYFLCLCLQYPDKHFPERLQQGGQQCFIALRGKAIVAYAWLTSRDLYIEEIARTYPVGPGEVFIYDCFVNEDYRGAGIYPAMLAAVVKDTRARNQTLKCVRIAASVLNQASIRGILKAGFVRQKTVHYVEYRRKQHWWGLDITDAETHQPAAK